MPYRLLELGRAALSAAVAFLYVVRGPQFSASDSYSKEEMRLTLCFCSVYCAASVPMEKVVIYKERSAGWYRLSAYYLAKMTSELPLILIQPAIFVVVSYWCIGFNGVAAFFATCVVVMVNAIAGQVGLSLSGVVICGCGNVCLSELKKTTSFLRTDLH